MRTFFSYLSFIEVVYNSPSFDCPGHRIPDEHGRCCENLKGNVRFAAAFHYKYVNNQKIVSNDSYYATFGKDGQLRHIERIDKEGNFEEEVTYFYDKLGRCMEYYDFDEKGNIISHIVYNYNEQGLLSSSESMSGGKSVFKYDNKGFLIEQRWDSPSFENSWKEVFINDEHGREIEMKEYRGQFDSKEYWYSRKIVTKYNDLGHIIELTNVDNDGKESKLGFDEYDDKGRVIKVGQYDIYYDDQNRVKEAKNPTHNTMVKVIYEKNTVIVLWFNEQLEIEKKRIIIYDDHQNITSILFYEGENLPLIEESKYIYEYYPE